MSFMNKDEATQNMAVYERSELYKSVNAAAADLVTSNGDDYQSDLIPIISFNKKKDRYLVEDVLPVYLRDDQCFIGVAYHENKYRKILPFGYDIYMKAKLFNPMYHQKQTDNAHIKNWFNNGITKLKVVDNMKAAGLSRDAPAFVPHSQPRKDIHAKPPMVASKSSCSLPLATVPEGQDLME